MPRRIIVEVRGLPIAKGSAKAFYVPALKRAVVTQSNKAKQTPWVSAIREAVFEECGRDVTPVGGVVVINRMEFFFPRPKSHYRTGKHASDMKADAPNYHTSKPDVDKLERCVLDALTGVLWKDDSQVAYVCQKVKCYCAVERGFLTYPGMTLDIELYGDEPCCGIIHLPFGEMM